MTEKEEKVFYVATHAGEDAERASLPFTLANAALVMAMQATIFLHGNGVFLAKKGYAKNVNSVDFGSFEKLLTDFMQLGGKLLVCVPCMQGRKIDESDLIEGAQTTAAAKVTTEMLTAQVHLVY